METRHPKIPEAWRSILRLEELDGDGVGFVQQFGRVFCCFFFDVFASFVPVCSDSDVCSGLIHFDSILQDCQGTVNKR